jgi:hypothetical protein
VKYTQAYYSFGPEEAKKLIPSEGQWEAPKRTKYARYIVLYEQNDAVMAERLELSDAPQKWEMAREKYADQFSDKLAKLFEISVDFAREANEKLWRDFDQANVETG